MSTITPISHAATSAADGTTTATTTVPQQTLGQDDFLRLLAQQFQSQDPMKPMEDTQFISQMAQFTSLQQSSAMSKDISAMKAQQEVATANSYLGHRVTVNDSDGNPVTGDVTAIKMVGSEPQLVVGESNYPLSAVVLVEPGAVSSSSANTPNP